MNVDEALKLRKSVRAFLDKPVEKEKIVRILEAASHAPSGTNAQPWQVAVVSGTQKKNLDRLVCEAFEKEGRGHPSYDYYPSDWIEPYRSRRFACGVQLYEALGIQREDKARRAEQWKANYRAFDAPVVLYFFLDKVMATGSFMDYGMFLQSLMLMAVQEGLATCPQAALSDYPEVVRNALGYDDNYHVVCGMALGYEDAQAAINTYRTPREAIEVFTRFFDES